jgi:hypothetical protein
MFGLPRILMGVRLARSGLRPEAFRDVKAPCQDCGEHVELQIIDNNYAHCPAAAPAAAGSGCRSATRTTSRSPPSATAIE